MHTLNDLRGDYKGNLKNYMKESPSGIYILFWNESSEAALLGDRVWGPAPCAAAYWPKWRLRRTTARSRLSLPHNSTTTTDGQQDPATPTTATTAVASRDDKSLAHTAPATTIPQAHRDPHPKLDTPADGPRAPGASRPPCPAPSKRSPPPSRPPPPRPQPPTTRPRARPRRQTTLRRPSTAAPARRSRRRRP